MNGKLILSITQCILCIFLILIISISTENNRTFENVKTSCYDINHNEIENMTCNSFKKIPLTDCEEGNLLLNMFILVIFFMINFVMSLMFWEEEYNKYEE